MSSGRIEVCLIGAGPRGLSVLERLCAHERKSPRWDHITVHVVDPDPPGSGRVWRPSQSRHLLMNTVASQVTVYTDDSVRIEGPLEEGPSLYQWAKALGPGALSTGSGVLYDDETLAEARDLGPDTYSTRALYGQYLTWVFQQVTANAAAHLRVVVHPVRAVALDDTGPHPDPGPGRAGAHHTRPHRPQSVTLSNGTELAGLSAVVLAQGHLPARPTPAERDLAAFAARHGLAYLPPANPADADLSAIAPGQSVLLRGLGLNFFDYLALFTHARGGVFERVAGRLHYRPSGREPRLYAGSRRGVPHQARGENEKGAHGRRFPRLLTADHITALRTASTTGGAGLSFGADLWPLIAKEVQSVYYEALLSARGQSQAAVDRFAARYLHTTPGPAEDRLLDQARITPAQRWDWEAIARPYGAPALRDGAAFHTWLRGHLAQDVRRARRGNVSGPVKAALDMLRDLRNEVRLAVDHGGLEATSHREELEGWYTPLNAYLSIGPPALRVEEMAALMDAGILKVTGPQLRVSAQRQGPDGPCFTATSAAIPGVRLHATALIEARLPAIDLRRTADPLLRRLLRAGQCRPYRIPATGAGPGHETGGLAVSPRPYHLLDAQGSAHPRRFAYGVPTESVHWVTAAGIRPGVGSVTLEDSDAIAAAVLALPELPGLPPVSAPPPTTTATTATTATATATGAGARS